MLSKLNRHIHTNREIWTGRIDGVTPERVHELVECIEDITLIPKNSIVLVGYACDEGIRRNQGRPGAASGPFAYRKALCNMPFRQKIYDLGNITCDDGDLEASQEALGMLVASVYQQQSFPIVIGGGHDVAWGFYQGIKNANLTENLGIVNFDAHYDLRPILEGGKGSSGTSFTQIAEQQHPFHYIVIGVQEHANTHSLHQRAKTLDTTVVYANHIESTDLNFFLDLHKSIFLTICMDVFSIAYAPGVSAPQPLGVTPQQVLPLLKVLAKSGKVIGFNIAELSPPLDRDDMTSKLAAALTMEFLNNTNQQLRQG